MPRQRREKRCLGHVGQGGRLQLNFTKWPGYLDGGGRSILVGGGEEAYI